jgi:hypothetical protein
MLDNLIIAAESKMVTNKLIPTVGTQLLQSEGYLFSQPQHGDIPLA